MFHQILHFLALKEETGNSEDGSNFYSRFLPEEEIQKVIFDKEYLKFVKNKVQ